MGKSSKGKDIGELGDLKKVFAEQIKEQEAQRRRAREAQAKAEREARQRAQEANLFANEFSDVVPIKDSNRVESANPAPPAEPRQRNIDEQDALASTLSDEIDLAQYLESDEAISYTAPGVGPDVAGRLRRGAWAISAQIDLHGLRRDEAREALVDFLDECRMSTKRCVRVIHGKGLGSVNREPVLKDKVRKWLVQRQEVLAFCQTAPNDGGSGALLVLLAGR
jgi:DNA-nicking Smr family endonuclease